jgi:hypothetical protein
LPAASNTTVSPGRICCPGIKSVCLMSATV